MEVSRSDWLAWRRQGIGGSDVPAIMLDDPRFGSKWELWLSKVHGVDPQRSGGAIRTGRYLEAAILEWAAAELRAGIRKASPIGHMDRDWMRATPDGWLMMSDGWAGVECKVTEYHRADPLIDHVLQCRWYMAVTNTDRWVLASFARKAPAWKLWIIDRDLDVERDMIEKCGGWWRRHVIEGIAPDLDGSRGAAVGLGHMFGSPDDREGFRVADEAEIALVRMFGDLDATIGRLEVDRSRLANQIRETIGTAAGLRWTGGRIRWSRGPKQRAGRLILRIDS